MRIRPTAVFYWEMALLPALFLQADMHNLNLVYILLFFLLAFNLAAFLLVRENLRPLRVIGEGSGRLFAETEGRCYLELERSRPGRSWGVRWCLGEASRPLPTVEAGRPLRVELPVVPPRRGEWEPGPSLLCSRFPLGTLEARREHRPGCRALVYPRPAGRPLAALLGTRHGPLGEESDFDGLGRYSGGESLSRIHWPSVAKGEPAVKRFLREEPRGVLLLDYTAAGESEEARLSQLTLWVLECEKSGRPFELRLPGRRLRSEKEGIDAILAALALY
jgi:uncharacterized protein (DUF58 family)